MIAKTMATQRNPHPDRLYRALVERDASYEGIFIVGVTTTGIFCRPTCRARKPKRENVEFFRDPASAARSGYRPCKVCRPTTPVDDSAPPFFRPLAERLYANPSERITDAELRRLGYAPVTVRRWFNANFKVTFHAWQRMIRLNAAFQRLQTGSDVTTTAFESGYESLSGFGESFKNTFGFAPSAKGLGPIIIARPIESPLGPLFACAAADGICYLQFVDQRLLESELKDLCKSWKARLIHGEHAHLSRLELELNEYFAGTRRRFDVPLAVQGTDFQKRAWRSLQQIPYGETVSYQEQAQALNAAGAVRAVGSANRLNRITIVIPCHRVIGKDGGMRGYGGGIWRKKWLLDLEATHVRSNSDSVVLMN